MLLGVCSEAWLYSLTECIVMRRGYRIVST
nr:MAG TPA: hypothetical protein [Caudoviricetes sp.]